MAARRKQENRQRKTSGTAALLALSQTALDGVSEGVCVYDAENRIVLFNRRYVELFNMSPDVIRPGISYAEVLTHSASLGNFPPEKLDGLICRRHALLASREPLYASADHTINTSGRTVKSIVSEVGSKTDVP